MHKHLITAALPLLVLALLAASCGDDADPTPALTGNNAATNNSTNNATNNGTANNAENNGSNNAQNNGDVDAGADAADSGADVATDAPLDEGVEEDVAADVADEQADDVAAEVIEDAPEDMGPDRCAEFAVVDANPAVSTLHAHPIEVVGGSGDVRFMWGEEGNQSDGILDELAGLYLAGPRGGVVDVIAVVDRGCGLTQEVRVDVVAPLVVLPPTPQMEPNQTLCFAVEGGTDELAWVLLQKGSGSTSAVDADGCYTSGAVPGEDVIAVVDGRTGQRVELRVQVAPGPLALTPSVRALALAPGDVFRVTIRGGSGVFDVVPFGSSATVEVDPAQPLDAARVTGQGPGTTELRVVDRFFPALQVTVPVHTMLESHHVPNPWGTHSDDNDVLEAGDLSGDGIGDLVVGVRGSSLNGVHAGAVFVYLGTAGEGYEAEPAQIITGSYRYSYMGRSLAAADFDADGCNDLAVSVWGSDYGGGDRGEVYLYRGCNTEPREEGDVAPPLVADNGAVWPEVPPLALARSWGGEATSDFYGFSLARGDFDGNGLLDLAVASPRYNVGNVVDAGRIYIYLNRVGAGLAEAPAFVIEGQELNAQGEPVLTADMHLGFRMRAGDVNQDGCDDLLVGSAEADNFNGYAALYLSAEAERNGSGCELSPRQAVGIAPADSDSRRQGRLGWQVLLGDVDQDCRLDLIVTQLTAAKLGGTNTSAGAVNIFFNDPTWSVDAPRRLTRDQADVVLVADDNDTFGADVALGDLNGDTAPDLVVGVRSAETAETVPDVGEVRIFPGLVAFNSCVGAPGGTAAFFGEPVVLANRADRNGDLFGNSLAVVSDHSGDQRPDLVILNPRGAGEEPANLRDHRGHLVFLPGSALSGTPTLDAGSTLHMPTALAEDLMGQAVESIGDVNADGYADFAVGAPYYDLVEPRTGYDLTRSFAGAVYVYFGGPDGMRATPDLTVQGHGGHTDSDFFGYDLAAGDIDGDGASDLIVAAPLEDADGTYCLRCRVNNTARTDIGALFVYRGGASFGARYEGEPTQLPVLSTPDYVICGPQISSRQIGRRVASGFDVDGDGRDDLVTSNYTWSASRGRAWYTSTAALSEAAPVLCLDEATSLIDEGPNSSDNVGYNVAGMDVNGDGCGDALVGAYGYDPPGFANAGAVIAVLGTGGAGCPATPTRIYLRGVLANDNIGYGLIPLDANGDGVQDLALASAGLGVANRGAVLVLDGLALRNRLAGAVEGAVIPLDGSLAGAPIYDPTNIINNNFGGALANAGDIDGDGDEELFIGAQLARFSPEHGERTGAAWLFLGDPSPSALGTPALTALGDARLQPDSRFGWDVAAARVGADGPVVLLSGAPWSERAGTGGGQMGAAFITNLSAP